MYTNILPDAEILRERFAYNKETGELRWAKGQNAGKIAGYLYTSYYRKFKHKKVPVKYWYVKLNGKKIYAHRIRENLDRDCAHVHAIRIRGETTVRSVLRTRFIIPRLHTTHA